MKFYVRKIVWCLLLIIISVLLTVLLDRLSPDAAPFTHNLTSLFQFIVLFWTIIALLQGEPSSAKKTITRVVIVLLCILLPDWLIGYWLNHPQQTPARLRSSINYYYSESGRNVIQYDPTCSVYDSSLFYTLKRNSRFRYRNYEFTDSFRCNSLGLRDDESSLHKPAIICLGDSYTMGWGVRQNETFAEQLSHLSGYTVLNTGISSYGTARELKNLYRLDTSGLKYLIIQYCQNDEEENDAFVKAGHHLNISPEQAYVSAGNVHYWNRRWFPGKHFISFCKLNTSRKLYQFMHRGNDTAAGEGVSRPEKPAQLFADILAHSSIDFSKVTVFVIDLNGKASLNNHFINRVAVLAQSPEYSNRFQNNLVMVPVADLLTADDYYILDPHLKRSGHKKIADRLYQLITARQ